MLSLAGSSYALFAIIWSVICLVAAAVVTDAMLRDAAMRTVAGTEQPGDVPAREA